ncbi:MAG: response regulator transcription factor, partial [Limisphaerales bacterium]
MTKKKSSPKGKEPKPLPVAKLAKTRVLLVDDHPTMREGLIRVIEREADLTVCGEAESIQRALEVIESAKPDIVVVD